MNDPVNYVDLWGLCGSDGEKSSFWDKIQAGLDFLGFIPGIGELADGANGVISLFRGDIVNAGLSFVSMIPIGGDAVGKGGKLLKEGLEKSDEFFDGIKRVFWTGMGDDGTKAANWVQKNGGITLEMTEMGKNLPEWSPQNASKWDNASLNFAESAEGDVTVLVGPNGIRDTSTFARVGFSELLNNESVTSITFVYTE